MFRDRRHAGQLLAEELSDRYLDAPATVVLGIPRGGVIVAAEVASRLHLPLDVVVTSKIGSPGNPEYAIGAVDPDGAVTANVYAGYSTAELERLGRVAKEKVVRRTDEYRARRPELELAGAQVILVDDGIATGLTALAAIDYVRRHGANRVVLAVPVISADAAEVIGEHVDALVAVEIPTVFYAVGQFYRSFEQTSDDEVLDALNG